MKNASRRATFAMLSLCGSAVLDGATPAQAAGSDSGPIEIALVSDAKSITPGETFTVAIHQKLRPGYHTYWRNPGTIGLPTSMEWELPDGFTAGKIQWPLPQITKMAAYHVWGYEGEALLLVEIKPPKRLKPGTPVTIRGKATWMCCGQQCHPGFEELSLTLPVGSKPNSNPTWKKAFDLVRHQQPRASDAWKITCTAEGDSYTLRLSRRNGASNTAKLGEIRFFDYDRQISSDKPQQMKREGGTYVLTLQQEEHSGDKLKRLRGILVARKSLGNTGDLRALKVDVPISRK